MFRILIGLALLAGAMLLADAVAGSGIPGGKPYAGHALVLVQLENQQQIETMLAISDDFFAEGVGVGASRFRVPPEKMEQLRASGLEFEILVEDLQVLVDAERQRLAQARDVDPRDGAWFEEYKTFDQINAFIDVLLLDHPDLISREQVGTSIEGRPIYALTMTGPDGDPSAKTALCFNGMQHSREWISPMTVLFFVDQFLDGYDTDPAIQYLLDELTFYIVPVVNPDGYIYSWTDYRLWRKNRRDNGDGTFGVDLNRNWSVGWGGPGSSGDPGDILYRGPEPFSEPETITLRDFILAHGNIVSHVDFHSYGQLILHPYSYDYVEPPEPDVSIMSGLGEEMADAIYQVHGVTYDPGPGHGLYLAGGICVDWVYDETGAHSWTIELRDTGFYAFELPPDQIIPTGEEILEATKELAEYYTLLLRFDFPQGLPEIVQAGEPTPIVVTIDEISGTYQPDSGMLLHRLGSSGPFQETPLTPLGGSVYEAVLPAAACGTSIEYYFRAETTEGDIVTDPHDAPTTLHDAQAFDIVVYFEDDGEASEGWDVSGDATDGQWDRGIPVDCARGDPPADADGSGQCHLTDNDAFDCNSDVDGGTTILTSPVIDASDPLAVLSYFRWYSNDYGADPFNDIFEVEVSDNGGASWVGLETVGPEGPEVTGGWYYRQFVIAEIPGIDNTDQFRVRYLASDLGPGSVVEAGVDHIAVKSYTCAGVPGDVNGDGEVDVLDLLAVIGAWGPCPGCPEDIDGNGVVDVLDLLAVIANWT